MNHSSFPHSTTYTCYLHYIHVLSALHTRAICTTYTCYLHYIHVLSALHTRDICTTYTCYLTWINGTLRMSSRGHIDGVGYYITIYQIWRKLDYNPNVTGRMNSYIMICLPVVVWFNFFFKFNYRVQGGGGVAIQKLGHSQIILYSWYLFDTGLVWRRGENGSGINLSWPRSLMFQCVRFSVTFHSYVYKGLFQTV